MPKGAVPRTRFGTPVIRVIKEVRGRRPHTKSRTLFQFEAAVKRKVYGFRARSDHIAHWIIAEPADIVLGRDECGGIDPLMDILIRRSYRNSTYYIRARCPGRVVIGIGKIRSRWIRARDDDCQERTRLERQHSRQFPSAGRKIDSTSRSWNPCTRPPPSWPAAIAFVCAGVETGAPDGVKTGEMLLFYSGANIKHF